MTPGYKREVVAKLKLPMPINEGIMELSAALQKIYGDCFVGSIAGDNSSIDEPGWFVIWRKVPDTADKTP